MGKLTCPNRKHPDWIKLETAVGKFEAFRDYMQYNGEIRDPFVVFDKIKARESLKIAKGKWKRSDARTKKLIKATEKYELGVMASLFQKLRNTKIEVTRGKKTVTENVISQKSWKKDETNPDITLVTIRKISTELNAAKGTKDDVFSFAGTKDSFKWNELKNIISYEESQGHDMDFFDMEETNDAYIIRVPTKVYDTAKSQKVTPDNFISYFRGNDNDALNISSESVLGNVINNMGSPSISLAERNNAQATSNVAMLAERLASNIKVEGKNLAYEFITPERANEIHAQMNASWNGEKAFFGPSKVYLVGNNMSLDIAFHEFSHPVIRALSKSNPVLFDKLFSDLATTFEGNKVLEEVRNLYPEYKETDALFKEEALVRALTLAATMAKQSEPKSSVFAKILNKILAALRQLIRKTGKNTIRDISKLTENTTLQELSEMMLSQEETLELGKDAYSEADSIAYVRDMHDFTKDILKMDEKDLLSLNIKGSGVAREMIEKMKTSQNYRDIGKILVGEYGEKDLQSILKALSPYAKTVTEGLDNIKNKLQHDEDRARAMINTLFRLQTIMNKLKNHLVLLSEDKNNIDNMNKAFYYEYFVNYWQGYAKEFMQVIMAKENIDKIGLDSPLTSLISSVNNQMSQILNFTKEFKKEGAEEFLAGTLGEAMKHMQAKHEKIIEHLKTKGGATAQNLIDREMEAYHGLNKKEVVRKNELADKIRSIEEEKEFNALVRKSFSGSALTREKIKMALEGKIDDANIFNSFFEGYMYNTDPVVGGFALFVKNHLNDVMSITQGKFNSYAHEMAPLLAKAGYTPADTGKLMKRVADVEEIGVVDKETGEVVGKPVWVLKSAHKNWRIDVDKIAHAKDKAERAWLTTNTEEAKQAFIEASAAMSKFQREFFHQKYKQEVYKAEELLEKDELGKRARFAMHEIFRDLNRLVDPLTNKIEELNNEDLTTAIWQKYNQLFSITDAFGQLKPKDSEEYKIAIRLQEYKAASIDPVTGQPYKHWLLKEGTFQESLNQFKQEVVDGGDAMGSKEYDALVKKWLDKNLRTVIKPVFYEERKKLTDELNDLLSTLPRNEENLKKGAEIYEKIFSIMKGYRDEDGQPNGLELTPEALAEINSLQIELDEFKAKREKMSGLTAEEEDDLRELFNRKSPYGAANELTEEEKKRKAKLLQKRKDYGLSSVAKKRIMAIYEELDMLQSKVPTTHYMTIINMWAKELGHKSYLNPDDLTSFYEAVEDKYKAQNKDFAKWFDKNHSVKERRDYQKNTVTNVVSRSYAWNVIQPNNEDHYETTPITDDAGNTVFVKGLPALKYYTKVVKPEYITPREVGVTIDNMGNYLPRLDVKDSPYINNEYLNMKNTDPAHYEILEAMKRHHLKNQEGTPMKSRLYLDIPRFRKNALELLQTKKLKEIAKSTTVGNFPFLTNLVERAKDFFRKAKDKAGSDYNWQDDAMLIRMDMFDNEVASIPVHGLYDLPIDDVSLDVNQSLMRYMFSVEKQKKLIEINPAARALQATLNDPENGTKDFGKINKFNFLHRGLVTYFNKKGKYVRRDAVNALIEREFEGKVQAGFTKDNAFLQNASELIFQRAGFAFFALNIPSAVKNMLGAKFQSMIEGSGGIHVDHASLAKGEGFSTKAMGDISLNLYKHKEKPLSIQIVDVFDMIKGRGESKLPESMSRTFTHDLVNFSWLYNFRKWTEGQASIQLGSAFLFKEKVDFNGKKIDYMDAWELSEGVIRLKSGVDVRYSNVPTTYVIQEGDTQESIAEKLFIPIEDFKEMVSGQLKTGREITVDNTKFNAIKNKMGTIQNNLNGAYDKFDQPDAQRYLAFRFISFMKRYFTTMFVNRWGFSGGLGKARGRFNPGMGDTQEGTYITVLKTLSRTFTMGADYYKFMNKEEKAAWIKFTVEVGSVIALLAILAPLLGWDPEDPERYEKLRKRSGAFPMLGVPEDPAHPFHMGGYMLNHTLKMALDVRAENEAFIPWPHFGLDNYMNTMTDASSVSFGPTLKSYKKMLEFAYYEATGNSKARYKKQAGPYEWQQEGGSKFVTEIAKSFGVTGSTTDPITNIKNVYGNK